MRKMMLLAAMVAIAALMMAAAPAFADDNNHNNNDRHLDRVDVRLDKQLLNNNNDGFRFNNDNDGFFFSPFFFDDGFGFDNFNRFNDFDNGVFQNNEQEVESGDATQNIVVSGGGANSNQCAGVQGITNTGNSVNNTSVLQTDGTFDRNNDGFFNNRFDDNRFDNRFFDDHRFNDGNRFNNDGEVEVNDVGNFEISPSQTTTCTQEVNQAATAAG
jgi:hypothetical protein